MIRRLTKSNETKTGNLSNDEHDFMRLLNEFPLFDSTPEKNFPKNLNVAQEAFIEYRKDHPGFNVNEKPYMYKGNISSKTKSHGWNFVFEEKNYAAMSVDMLLLSRAVLFYETDDHGKFEIEHKNVIDNYPMYVDVEAAVDRFCEERRTTEV